MSQILNKRFGNSTLYYFNQIDAWQGPVITELQILNLFLDEEKIPTNYFAFPWASLCDNHLIKTLSDEVIDNLNSFSIKDSVCFTVIQHYRFRTLLPLFKKIGITHVFTSHRTHEDDLLEKSFQIQILPLSIFPIYDNISSDIINFSTRKFLATFIGSYESYYLTSIRKEVYEKFSKNEKYQIILRNEWHFASQVYEKKTIKSLEFEKNEYLNGLMNSKFSLCPSGSGPNSIRIWESMSYGTIPVILSDTLKFPELDFNYNDIFIIFPEKNISELHDFLLDLSKQQDKIKSMSELNIQIFNQHFSKQTMHSPIWEYFNKRKALIELLSEVNIKG